MTAKQLSHDGVLACERPDVSSSTTWKTVLRQLLLLNGITPSCHTCMSPPLSKRQVEQGCDAIQQRRIEAVIAGAAGAYKPCCVLYRQSAECSRFALFWGCLLLASCKKCRIILTARSNNPDFDGGIRCQDIPCRCGQTIIELFGHSSIVACLHRQLQSAFARPPLTSCPVKEKTECRHIYLVCTKSLVHDFVKGYSTCLSASGKAFKVKHGWGLSCWEDKSSSRQERIAFHLVQRCRSCQKVFLETLETLHM